MATIALNWELGADLGHVGRLLPIALELKAHGHRPVLIMRDLSRAEALLGSHDLECLQAPVWVTPVRGLPPVLNLTETLMRFGYLHPQGLLGLCRAWRTLWSLLAPELLIFDQAPTAMLAARGLGLPTISVGNSFAMPPRRTPLPSYGPRTSGDGTAVRMAEAERRVLGSMNHVLDRLHAPRLTCVADNYAVDRCFLCVRPELDVYGADTRDHGEVHIGPVAAADLGVPPRWPDGTEPRVFCYLKGDYAALETLLQALAKAPVRCVIHAAGMSEQLKRRFSGGGLAFSEAPLRLRDTLAEAHAVICHGGSGVLGAALDHGLPVLGLPMQIEQLMNCRMLEALGSGLTQPLKGNPGKLGALLRRLVEDEGLRAAASAHRLEVPPAGAAHMPVVEAAAALLS